MPSVCTTRSAISRKGDKKAPFPAGSPARWKAAHFGPGVRTAGLRKPPHESFLPGRPGKGWSGRLPAGRGSGRGVGGGFRGWPVPGHRPRKHPGPPGFLLVPATRRRTASEEPGGCRSRKTPMSSRQRRAWVFSRTGKAGHQNQTDDQRSSSPSAANFRARASSRSREASFPAPEEVVAGQPSPEERTRFAQEPRESPSRADGPPEFPSAGGPRAFPRSSPVRNETAAQPVPPLSIPGWRSPRTFQWH